jgi:hypothetical protein
MVRTTTEADDESTTTIRRRPRDPTDFAPGVTVDVSGPSFLPKSELEVVEVDDLTDGHNDAIDVVARIPNRSNARDYHFRVDEYGNVKTTNSRGVFGPRVDAEVEVEPDTVECSLCGSEPVGLGSGMSSVDEDEVPPRCRRENKYVVDTDKAPDGCVWVCPSCHDWVVDE